MASKKLYTFRCDKWLSNSEDDGQIIREITCGNPEERSSDIEQGLRFANVIFVSQYSIIY